MPWHLGTDLRRFRRLTTGHAVVMGRRTWDSIGRPLPDRISIVVTTNTSFAADGATVVHSIEEAFDAAAAAERTIDIIGGAALYAQTIDRVDTLQLTRVHASPAGDTYFPGIGPQWVLVAEESHDAGPDDDHAFTFQTWRR